MTTLSRRQFLIDLKEEVLERVNSSTVNLSKQEANNESAWSTLGKLTQFPVNTVQPCSGVEVVSSSLGISAFPQGEPHQQSYALRLNSFGELEVDLTKKWPVDYILSLFSGECIYGKEEAHHE